MGDQGIPAPSFDSDIPFNSISNDQFIEEEVDSFQDFMESRDKEQEKVQEEARTQVEKNKKSLESLVQKEEMDKEASLEDEEKGVEEEDAKSLSEKEEAQASEEARISTADKGKEEKSLQKETDVEEERKDVKKGGKEELERKGSVKSFKKQTFHDRMSREHRENVRDVAEDMDHELRSKESLVTDKAHAKAMRAEEQQAEARSKFTKKSGQKEGSSSKKTEEKKEVQSIAANLALNAAPLEASKSQKGQLNAKIEKADLQKELESLVKKIMEESEVLRNGDEIKTTISVDMPDSKFDRGEITISAFKYRPLEVNLKFTKFNADGTKMLKQNQEDLKNVLKLNSLKVHQLEIIE